MGWRGNRKMEMRHTDAGIERVNEVKRDSMHARAIGVGRSWVLSARLQRRTRPAMVLTCRDEVIFW